jgi:hypothetical protein
VYETFTSVFSKEAKNTALASVINIMVVITFLITTSKFSQFTF